MEKGYSKYQGRFWLIVFSASIFLFFLFYFPLSDFRRSNNDQTKNKIAYNLVISQEQRSILTPLAESPGLLVKSPHSSARSPNSTVKSDSSVKPPSSIVRSLKTDEKITIDRCKGRYIYVIDLPSRFNRDLLKECQSISLWNDMCKFTSNAGLGPAMERSAVFSDTGWFATNQFTLEVIFHNRMKQYDCLTKNSSLAVAIFVPFYAGLDISRYLWGFNISMRDSTSLDLVDWLAKRPEWKVMGGKDHFLVAGRITWDFRRVGVSESDWGNKLFLLPKAKNMSMLVVDSSPWHSNDFAIPYPTYFHPAKDRDVFYWQNRVRKIKRPWLFAFAGAPRPNIPISIRDQIIDQCRASKFGFLLDCSSKDRCNSPSSIMSMFESSVFCLQPQGDSFTRRSVFDSMLAGCIPVFFHPGSAYIQYTWHLPRNYSKYSVFITEEDVRKGVSIEKILLPIPEEQVRTMREEVIKLIPRIIYADPKSRLETVKDAFDVSVQAVIDKIDSTRRMMKQGVLDEGFREENSWKYALLGSREKAMEEHEWDHFFSKPVVQNSGESSALPE